MVISYDRLKKADQMRQKMCEWMCICEMRECILAELIRHKSPEEAIIRARIALCEAKSRVELYNAKLLKAKL